MSKIPRVFQKIFGSNASNNGQFGSAAAGTKVLSTDLPTLMGLAAYLAGWSAATVSGDNLPTLEEMQGLNFINTTQLAYIFQEGIPEYDASTTYFINSIVKKAGTYQIYGSVTDNNTGNALSNGTYWTLLQDLSAPTTSGMVLLATKTASASASLDFTSVMDATKYSKYVLVFNDLLNSASASIGLKISSDNGSTWTMHIYSQLQQQQLGGMTAPAYTGVSDDTPAVISDSAANKFNGEASFTVNATIGIDWEGRLMTAGDNPFKSFVSGTASTALVNAIRLLPSSGNFTSGKVYLYGLKNT